MISPRTHQQHGESLISMLVGMLLALLSVGAMFTVYQTLVKVSGTATRTAIRDGQVASALLAAQIELQQAGFGMTAADGGVNLNLTGGGRQLVWRYRQQITDATFLCSGLRLVVTTPSAATDGIYLLPPIPCASADAALTWNGPNAPQLLATSAAFFAPEQLDPAEVEARSYSLGSAQFRLVSNQDCGPFGITTGNATRTRVILEDTSPASPAPAIPIFTYCLTNT